MSRFIHRFLFAGALFGAASISASACSTDRSQEVSSSGSIGLALNIAPGLNLSQVSYTITGPSGFTKNGVIAVANSSTIAATVVGLPPGTGYTLSLMGTTTDGTTTCGGSAKFDVVAKTTTTVTVALSCKETPRTGSVSIQGVINVCPVVDGIAANPAEVAVGSTIALSSTTHDSNVGPAALTFAWTASSGSFDDASSATATFKCTQAGVATLKLVVSDGDCTDTSSVQVACSLPIGTTATLTLLESTDLHQNIISYDYYKLAVDKSLGFERLATLINQARVESPNNLLIDDGDTIQGTPLGDYQALVSPVACDAELAMYKVMDLLKYDAGNIGNHEFNYGLPYLNQVTGSAFDVDPLPAPAAQMRCKGPSFPQVLANVYSQRSKKPLFAPYKIINKPITATAPDGSKVDATINVGVIGFTPPTILSWDKRWLEGKVYTVGVKETAESYIPEMRRMGANLVVGVSHGGLDNSPYDPTMENGSWWLTMAGRADVSQPALIDALLIGHSHQIFPNAASTVPQFKLPGVDRVKGTVNGVPTVMANFWGKHLGVIKLTLTFDGTNWVIDQSKTVVEARSIQNADKSFVEADPAVAQAVAAEHQATIDYVKTPIGVSNFRMTTYFADVGEVTAIQAVNQAQTEYVTKYIAANLPAYAGLPVLSVSAPFKSGFAGGADFTDVAAGSIAINNAADLYLFANTIYAVKVTGADIKAWLETSAKRFNQIDPTKVAAQSLVSSFPGYNFDVFTSPDLKYQIDVTAPVGSRIVGLTYLGAPVGPAAEFVVATNNYRASGGGNFPGLDGSKTIIASPDASRDVLIDYIKKAVNLTLAANGSARSWSFVPVTTAGPVTFTSAQGVLPVAVAEGITNVSLVTADAGNGLSLYGIDLSK